MFQIHSIYSDRGSVQFVGGEIAGNRIHVITGPNGSGKTDLLTLLANHYRFGQQDRAAVKASTHPARVIAQTFSPFSRFPSAKRGEFTVSATYADGRKSSSIYEPVGYHKSLRHVGGSFSRHVLEEAIFRLSESVERVQMVGTVLDFLGFKRQISFQYKQKPALEPVLRAYLNGSILKYLQSAQQSHSSSIRYFASEVKQGSLNRAADLLESALDVLAWRDLKAISLELEFYQARTDSFAKLQALSVLRRYGFLRLEHCEILHPDHGKIALSFTSSGQQQLLCSLFGMASALQSNALVLIDEPELSLHPRWQIGFLDQLADILRAVKGCHILIATHSPLIVQRALELRLGTISLENGGADLSHTNTLDRRPSVEETLIDVFDAPVPNSLYLGNELVRLINSAHEEGSQFLDEANKRIRELKSVYAAAPGLQLIKAAEAAINEDTEN